MPGDGGAIRALAVRARTIGGASAAAECVVVSRRFGRDRRAYAVDVSPGRRRLRVDSPGRRTLEPSREHVATAVGSSVRIEPTPMADRDARVVYSTGTGRICPECGRPLADCEGRHASADEAVPSRIVAKLRMERTGRGGKTVTVIDGLPRNAACARKSRTRSRRSP
jgi:hypothetical protein